VLRKWQAAVGGGRAWGFVPESGPHGLQGGRRSRSSTKERPIVAGTALACGEDSKARLRTPAGALLNLPSPFQHFCCLSYGGACQKVLKLPYHARHCRAAVCPVCLSACLPVIQTLTPSRPSTPAVVQPRHGTGDCFYRNLLHAASPRLALHIPHLNMAFSKTPTSHACLCTRNRWPKIIAATITRRTTYNNRSPQSSQAALHTALVP
jgi:hypothetical protein